MTDVSAFALQTKVFHWVPEKDEWEPISWEDWSGFRGIMQPSAELPGISGGIHHFIVCVLDDDGTVVNLIPHKYLVNVDGTIGADNFAGLTKDERKEYWELMIAKESREEDQRRLEEIHNKMGPPIQPPSESVEALKWALPNRPLRGSAAERFLAKFK